MIARIWRGRTKASDADRYQAYIHETGPPMYASYPGNRGIYVLRRTEGDTTEFRVLSFWDSMEEIRAFAGPDIERAIYFPEDDAYLLEKEPHVTHFEVTDETAAIPERKASSPW